MEIMKILGLRNFTTLYRIENGSVKKFRVMLPITEKQEKYLGEQHSLKIHDSFTLNGDKVVSYGEHNIDTEEGKDYICRLNVCSQDTDNYVYVDIDYKTGEVSKRDGKFLQSPTWDNIIWFKYNLCLIGNPKRVVIFDVNKEELLNLCYGFRESSSN